jgi:hypothetical protein
VGGDAANDEPLMYKIPPVVADMAAQIGIVRLLNLGVEPKQAPPIVIQTANAYLPQTVGDNLKAVQSFPKTLANASPVRQLGDRPKSEMATWSRHSRHELVVRGVNALAIEIAATQIKPACAG